jgi:mRNA interferase MazF
MNRGEVWWVNFDPSVGGEIQKQRPAVIVSNDAAIRFLNRLQVVPMTSRMDRVYPSEAVVHVGRQQSKVMADQITTVSKQRLADRMGRLSGSDLAKVEHVLMIQLGLVEAAE